MNKIEASTTERQQYRDFPAWIVVGIVASLGALDVIVHYNNLSQTAISASVEAIAFPIWAAWGAVRGHNEVLYNKIQHKLHKG